MCTINHEKKAIFINIPKTARTYISENLVKYYGFIEYLNMTNDHEKLFNNNIDLNKHSFLNTNGILDYYKNSKEMSFYIGMDEEKWNSYYKFCFVRNPYDRAVSGYHYIISKNNQEKIKHLKENTSIKITQIPFHRYYLISSNNNSRVYIHTKLNQTMNISDNNNKIFINYVGKFENLEEDFKKILLNIGFKEEDIKHDKIKKNSTDHGDYRKYYINNEILNEINKLYEQDFINFDYVKYTDYTELLK